MQKDNIEAMLQFLDDNSDMFKMHEVKVVVEKLKNNRTFREIGEMLGITRATAHESFARNIKKIEKAMRDDGIHISEFELGGRIYDSLKRANIKKWDDLSQKKLSDIQKIRNIGPNKVAHILSVCNKRGIMLIDDIDK